MMMTRKEKQVVIVVFPTVMAVEVRLMGADILPNKNQQLTGADILLNKNQQLTTEADILPNSPEPLVRPGYPLY